MPVQAAGVAELLDRAEVVRLSGVVAPEPLAAAKRELVTLVERHGRANFTLLDLERESETAIGDVAGDVGLRTLVEELVRIACPPAAWPHLAETVSTSLNVTITNDRASTQGTLHYDASVVTVVIPLQLPDCGTGSSGELVVFPNHRKLRHSVARNVIDKFRAQTGGTAARMLERARRGDGGECLALREGDAYVFWGYRSMHGNLPCGPEAVRATLTIHGGDPHGRDPVLRMFKQINEFRASRLGARRVVHSVGE